MNFFPGYAQKEFIATLDPVNGTITKIDSIPGVMIIVSTAAYDQSRKRYTFLVKWDGPTSMYTVDAVSGQTIAHPLVSSPEYFISFQYSRTNGKLYAILHITNIFALAMIDETTGLFTIIQILPGIEIYEDFTIDELNHRLFVRGYTTAGLVIAVIDLVTGNIISQTPITGNVYGFRYDNASNNIYAIRSSITGFSICTIDPFTGIYTDIANLPGISGLAQDAFSGFNENDHLYYLEWRSATTSYLSSINVNTGAFSNTVPVPTSGSPDNDNLIFYRYDNLSSKLYALLWEAARLTPVTLNRLDAALQEKSVLCKWQTFQEINSDYFIVERSDDGINFIPADNVKASGNSNTSHEYSFTDRKPFSAAKEYLYYRLRMVDIDGRFVYSNTANVKLKFTASLNVFPNPATDHLSVNFYGTANENATILITNEEGKKCILKILK